SVTSSIHGALGYEPDDFLSRSPLDLIHPDDRPDAEITYHSLVRREAGEVTAEIRRRHAFGEWRWIELLATNEVDQSVGAAVVTFRDISDRKEAAEALRRSEERFKALAQHSFDVMLIVAEDQTITYASPSVERVFGYPPD